mgnify:CR=1 FL=1
MQKKIEMKAPTDLNFSPLKKNQEGLYSVPTMRCGVLPFYIDNDTEIIWGCVESNRVGPIIIMPPAGIQDIIIMKDELCFNLEVGKPLPDLKLDFLSPFIGKLFRDKAYQEIIASLIQNKFNVYVENPLETALHETQEEHGVDLRNEGKDRNLLNALLELPLQQLSGKQGATTQYTCIAFLKSCDDVILNYTNKIENKIRRNFGRSFYEKGCWGTLNSFKMTLKLEREKFDSIDKQTHYTPQQVDLIEGMLSANHDAIELLEKIELWIRFDLEQLKLAKILAGEGVIYQNCVQELATNYRNSRGSASSMLEIHGIFNLNTQLGKDREEKKDTYCGFKPGFLTPGT